MTHTKADEAAEARFAKYKSQSDQMVAWAAEQSRKSNERIARLPVHKPGALERALVWIMNKVYGWK